MQTVSDLITKNPIGKQSETRLQTLTETGLPVLSPAPEHADAVDVVFEVMARVFPRRFVSIWKTASETASSKREWLMAFADCPHLTPQTLEVGLRAVRTLDWPPDNPGEFLKLCQISPDLIGAPSAHDAFLEAAQHTHACAPGSWSHKCVYRAATDVGLGVIEQRGWNAEKEFATAYQRALNVHHTLPEAPTAELPAPPVEPAAPEFVADCLAKVRAGLAAAPERKTAGEILRPRAYLIGEFMGARTIARDFRHVSDLHGQSLARMASARSKLLRGEYV